MIKKNYFFSVLILSIIISVAFQGCSNKRSGKPHVLVFSKTDGYRHASIPDGKKAIQKLGTEHGFIVDTTENADKFNEDTLKKYSAVIFLSTTHDVLNFQQQAAFKRYIQAGGGFMGVHAASDTEYNWPWYHDLVGAYFKDHPQIQDAKLNIHKDSDFPTLDSLPNPWSHRDEWYDFRSVPENVHVLVDIDQSSYQGSTMGKNHPLVWYHKYDGGRSFYMELGHTKEAYTEPNFLKILLAGIEYAIGENQRLDYSQATQLLVPDPNRFTKKKLAGGLDEPTELTVLPNLDILVAQRKGGVKYYNSKTKKIKEVAKLDVYHVAKGKINGNVEMGLLGLKADPNYAENHWVYAYYSPVGKSVDRLSRFKFRDQQFDKDSEQVILEVPTDREMCCHTGGSIAFDADNNLYLSVGDNTTPFDEMNPKTGKPYPINTHGYAPLDDRPGFEHFDDGRSAGNTNDLRGKILRIHVNKDGSYDIPDGNLFDKNKAGTKPEIYVMGDRNPYRISVDKHTGYLYWGEVGPDANNDSLKTHGPRGYDEINQAKKAGNFGWPFVIGNNYPYRHYNYAEGEAGTLYNPEHPVNDSRNNDGIDTLPPAQPAFIWYPYAKSEQFPSLGSGGRTAMAGPVYYVDDYPKDTRYPKYYDGKFFAYEWIRDWIKVVTMNDEGDLKTIEPFMPAAKFNHISDLEVGADGRFYEVEYGKGWFSQNPNAGLYVIDYNGGNRAPDVAVTADKKAGSLPLTIHLNAEDTNDPDGDPLHYTWNFGNGDKKETDDPHISYEYSKIGNYKITLTASDGNGGVSSGTISPVVVGNERPQVSIKVDGNKTFYFPDKTIHYQTVVQDKEDGSSDQSKFDKSRLIIKADYFENTDTSEEVQNGDMEQLAANIQGKTLMESSDCESCHKVSGKSVGPSFQEVSQKYADNSGAVNHLTQKIINGGSGVWGEIAMPAHPNLSKSDAQKIVDWILSIGEENKRNMLPISGTINPSKRFKLTDEDYIHLIASYKDMGANGVSSLMGTGQVILRNPYVKSISANEASNFSKVTVDDNTLFVTSSADSWLKFDQISLEDIKKISVQYGVQKSLQKGEGWTFQIRLDDREGKLIGETTLGEGVEASKNVSKSLQLTTHQGNADLHDVYFIFAKKGEYRNNNLGLLGFRFETE